MPVTSRDALDMRGVMDMVEDLELAYAPESTAREQLWQLREFLNEVATGRASRLAAVERLTALDIEPRHRLILLLRLARLGAPWPVPENEMVQVVLPAAVYQALAEGLVALEGGEVHDIFDPTRRGRHGEPWSKDRAKCRLVQHVYCLAAREGLSIDAAQLRVSDATGVPRRTIEEYRAEIMKWDRSLLDIAVATGLRLAGGDARFGHAPFDALNTRLLDSAKVQAFLRDIEREPLEDFGARFKERFGGRHWGGE